MSGGTYLSRCLLGHGRGRRRLGLGLRAGTMRARRARVQATAMVLQQADGRVCVESASTSPRSAAKRFR